jgi:hypothetical protein
MKRAHPARFRGKKGKVMENQFNAQSQQFSQYWQKAVTDQLSFFESFYEQVGKVQSNGVAQLSSNIDEATRLAKQSISQAEQLVSQWRKLILETARRATEVVAPAKA